MKEESPKQVNREIENPVPLTVPKGIFDWVLVILFIAIVGIMTVSISFRYVLNSPLSWTDEVIRFSFVWFTFLGAAIVFRDNAHIRIDSLLEIMPPYFRNIIEKISWLLSVCFYLFLLIAGMIWVFETQGTHMTSLRLPLNWFFYFALPVTSAVALYFVFFSQRHK